MHPFPTLPADSFDCLDTEASCYPHSAHFSSPSNSALLTSYDSSNWSDRQSTPCSSPRPSIPYSPRSCHRESLGGAFADQHERIWNDPCVAMHDIQKYADAEPELVSFEEDQVGYGSGGYGAYGTFAQEGYQPMQANDDAAVCVAPYQSQADVDEEACHATCHNPSPTIKRRRAPTLHSIISPHLPSKVTKRAATARRSSSNQKCASPEASRDKIKSSNRPFPCPLAPYGCCSTFASKNEWKRHVNTQHLRLGYWRCDQCPNQNKKPNNFNRKDLFTQHVRRMHSVESPEATAPVKHRRPKASKTDAVEAQLARAANRCYQSLRSPPEHSCCVLCDQEFHGPSSWDARMEHIGKHMEAAKRGREETARPGDWSTDESTERWMAAQGLIVRSGKRWVLSESRT